MKKLILFLGLSLCLIATSSISKTIPVKVVLTFHVNGLDDGWYSASVDYNNEKTGYSNSYDLEVEVEGDEVVEIKFPDGGYIHTGDDDYTWSGGDLDYDTDEEGKVTSATTTVTITDSNDNEKTYEITIDN
jgi:hypothetical protein